MQTNNYFINLKKDKYLFFKPINSLELIKFIIIKMYIKINFTNKFIYLS